MGKYSLKKLIRMPIITLLAITLLSASSFFFLTELAIYHKSITELDIASKYFTTIGTIRLSNTSELLNKSFMGELFGPDYADISLAEINPILESEYIEKVDIRSFLGAYLPDFEIINELKHFNSDEVFIEGTLLDREIKNDTLYGKMKVNNVLASKEGMKPKEIIDIEIDDYFYFREFMGFDIEKGHRYFCILTSNDGGKTYKNSRISADCMVDITDKDENYLEQPDMEMVKEEIDNFKYNISNFNGIFTSDIDLIFPFYKGDMFISSGRKFTKEEYDKGLNVCIISQSLAKEYGFKPGDEIKIAFNNGIFYADGRPIAVFTNTSENVILPEKNFQIVGIYFNSNNNLLDIYNYNSDTIFFPKNSYPEELRKEVYSVSPYDLSFRLKSLKDISAFLSEVESMGLDDYEIVIEDKGFYHIENIFNIMKESAIPNLIIASVAALIIMIFIIYVYVTRQGHDFVVMRAMGTPVKTLVNFFLIIILVIAVAGILCGFLICMVTIDDIIERNYNEILSSLENVQDIKGIISDSQYIFDNKVSLSVLALGSLSLLTVFIAIGLIQIKHITNRPILSLLGERRFKRWCPIV